MTMNHWSRESLQFPRGCLVPPNETVRRRTRSWCPTPVPAVPGSRHDSGSETMSVPGIDRRTHRRLNLVWRAIVPDPVPVQNELDAPDSHDHRLFRLRRAMQIERQELRRRTEPPVPGPHPPSRGADIVNLQEELRGRVQCLQGVPSFLRGQFRSAGRPVWS